MGKKIIKAIVGVVVAAVCLYFSVYVQKLDVWRAEMEKRAFHPASYIDRFWDSEMPDLLTSERIVDLDAFMAGIENDRESFVTRHGNTLGVGAPYSLLARGDVRLVEAGDEVIRVVTAQGHQFDLRTSFIFGNTVREATGYFNIDDFENTMDFNLISIELNNRITQRVIAPVLSRLTAGQWIGVTGAIDVRDDATTEPNYEIVPIQINIPEDGRR